MHPLKIAIRHHQNWQPFPPLQPDQAGFITIPQGTNGLKIEVPILDVQGYWHPMLYRPKMQLDWTIQFVSAFNNNFPFITFFNTKHRNRVSLGLADIIHDTEWTAKLDQTAHAYNLELIFPPSITNQPVKLWINQTDQDWTDSLAAYRQSIRNHKPAPQYPDAAWLPVYCTWYARHRRLDTQWVESAASIAAELGFGTIILDDGWSCEDASTVNLQTIVNWYGPIGDWRPDPKKFPDFADHVRRVQKMGISYLLWVSPLMFGMDTPVGQRWHTTQTTECGFYMADATNPQQTADALAAMRKLMEAAPLDGLKVDFLDFVKPSLENPQGPAMQKFMVDLAQEIRDVRPNAMIEYRQQYTGIGSMDLATNFRANDVPYDFVENMHRIAQIRICLGDGVPVHADPAYWHPQESDLNISRHLLYAMAGVPMLSVDLTALPEKNKKIIAQWMKLYRDCLPIFKTGTWKIYYHFDQVAAITVKAEQQSVVLIYDPCIWPTLAAILPGQTAMIINASLDTLPLKKDTKTEHPAQPITDMYGDSRHLSNLPPCTWCRWEE